MQIFKKTKKYITGIIYPNIEDSIIVSDKSEEAIKILNGYKFNIVNDKIIFTGEQEIKKDKKYYLFELKKRIDKDGVNKENIKELINLI
jgi:hypothetical protein